MKKLLVLSLILSANMLIVPLISYGLMSDYHTTQNNPDLSREPTVISYDTISVYNADTSESVTLDFRDYIIGVVAAEMPAQFHEEALSACAVAAATLARKKISEGSDKTLNNAVISTDPAIHQAFMDKEKMHERWGDDFNKYYEKIEAAVDKAIDYSITYDGELIVPAYHAISTGKTEDAENIWSGGFPYLTSVESEGDRLSPGYKSEYSVTFDEFSDKMQLNGAKLPEDKTLWFHSPLYTAAGTLTSIKIGSKSFSGEELRSIFSLRSSAIEMSMNDEGITFRVKGYGHGVGMSQYGADYYARQGYTWQEIIKHYYTGAQLEIL